MVVGAVDCSVWQIERRVCDGLVTVKATVTVMVKSRVAVGGVIST